MNPLAGVSTKTVAASLVAFIVIGGFALALLNTGGASGSQGAVLGTTPFYNGSYYLSGGLAAAGSSNNAVAGTVTSTMSSTTVSLPLPPQTVVVGSKGGAQVTSTQAQSQLTFNQPGSGNLIEFFSNLTMESPTPSTLASKVVVLAYSVGGYVAYQSTLKDSAYLVVRVPAGSYQQVLGQIQDLGNVTSLTSTSNDVTVKYTDLNATLASLITEQEALLRLINQSTSVNSTLAIETQLQYVNAQINSVKSQVLQTQRLVSYSTITASISKAAESKPLSMTLSATPKNGVAPLGVTFNAVVSGGQSPYLVNYNFGDGTSQQGQVVVHQFYDGGDYNVTVSATDSKGSVAMASALVHATAPPAKVGFGDFGVTLASLLIRVVEGIAEVAVVALPVALVLAVVVYPLRRRGRAQKDLKQG